MIELILILLGLAFGNSDASTINLDNNNPNQTTQTTNSADGSDTGGELGNNPPR